MTDPKRVDHGQPDPAPANQPIRTNAVVLLLWRLLAVLAFALAIIGALLPVMPTVPFLLLAAWAASRGWPRFERWLLEHAVFGPPITRWRMHGAVSRRAKWLASVMMASSAVLIQFLPFLGLWPRIVVPLVMLLVAIWLWRRPEHGG